MRSHHPLEGRSIPYYICPNCRTRSFDADGIQGLSHQAVGCPTCGFGFVFELLDDYFPHADAGMVACDRESRVLAAGRGMFELSGYREPDLIGRPVVEALGLTNFDDGRDPIATTLEWGVRQLGKTAVMRHASGRSKPVVCDIFPGYDSDGGLLVAVAPRTDD
jgi:PAS domain S-box-containing protein